MKKMFLAAMLLSMSAQFAAATNYLVAGAGTSAVNGTYVQQSGTMNGYNYYKNGSFYLYSFLGGGSLFWVIGTNPPNETGEYYYGYADQFGNPTDPTKTTFSSVVSPAVAPGPTVTISPYTIGATGGDYSTLKGAFDAINAGSITGVVTIQIIDNTTETASAVLNASGTGSASYTSVKIYPTVSGKTISGSIAGALINLNGADNVTIDGRLNRSGAMSLTISNTSNSSTAGTSTIKFINDATSDSVKYCTLTGSSTTAWDGGGSEGGGIVLFSTTTGTTGNDGNTVIYNNFTKAGSNRPYCAVASIGTTAKTNSGNTISNNNFYDHLNFSSVYTIAVNVCSYSTGFTIQNNSFYETASYAPTGAGTAVFINSNIGDNTITGNYIGGSAVLCGGSAMTKTNAYNNEFWGINAALGVTGQSIQGNTIRNIAWSNSGSANFYGISIQSGVTNVGTSVGNTIGSATGTGSITFTAGASNANCMGVYCISGTVSISGNTIGSITAANSFNNGVTNFIGIKLDGGGTYTVSGNTIGSALTSNSVNLTSLAAGATQRAYGIWDYNTATASITDNTIANITNGTTDGSNQIGFVHGIYSQSGAYTITGNTIHHLTIGNSNLNVSQYPSVAGIEISKGTTTAAHTISGNTIYELSNTYGSSAALHVYGIYLYDGSFTASSIVSKNFIYNLTASNNDAGVYGIYAYAANATYSNNIIALGGNTNYSVYGLADFCTSSGTSYLYFNTVYIGGTPTTGSSGSYAIWSNQQNTKVYKNNLAVNARSNSGSASGTHYAVTLYSTLNTTINNNDYVASGTGGVLGRWANTTNETNISLWRTVTGQEAASQNSDPQFSNAGGTSAMNYRPAGSNYGVNGTGITTDYRGYTRNATFPSMGAIEIGERIYVKAGASGLNNGSSWTNAYTTFEAGLNASSDGKEIWVAAGTYYPTNNYSLTASSRYYHFELRNGIKVYGGFAGTETELSARNVTANETILSGDLDANDSYADTIAANIASNAYHVIYNPSTRSLTTSTILDGFTIKGGNANGTSNEQYGGGLYNDGNSFTISNCKFSYNTASYLGAGIFLTGGSFAGAISGCTINNNYISTGSNTQGGGGLYSNAGAFTMDNCTFTNNYTKSTAGVAGAWLSAAGSPRIKNTTFSSNRCYYSGGAIRTEAGSMPTFINCLFTGNTSSQYAGAMSINTSGTTFVNCTVANNKSVVSNGGGAIWTGNDITINNSIFWGNEGVTGGKQITNFGGTTTINNSCYSNSTGDMYGTVTASNSITTDPLFVSTSNFSIKGNSPCVDAGNDFYNSETYDMRGTGYARKLNKTSGAAGTIDIGAYEYKVNTDPLPVELASFTAEVAEKGVELKWKTATEINNYGFEVEKNSHPEQVSPDAIGTNASKGDWIKIGFVEGNGTTNAPKSYSFTDKSANGTSSYRLKQIDRDGKFVYSQTVEVSVISMPKEFTLQQNYPNPFNPTTAIGYQLATNGHTTLKIYDAIGREVATLVNEVKEAGYYSVQFNGIKLSSGVYFAKLTSNGKMQIRKLMLIK